MLHAVGEPRSLVHGWRVLLFWCSAPVHQLDKICDMDQVIILICARVLVHLAQGSFNL